LPLVAELAEGRLPRALGGHVPRVTGRPRRRSGGDLDQLTLVAAEENDVVDINRSPRMCELPNPSRLSMFATDHRRGADTRFFRGRGPLPTEWSAGFLRAPRTFDLSRWLPPVLHWEPDTDLWVATPVVVSYLADSLRNEYSSAWQVVYSKF